MAFIKRGDDGKILNVLDENWELTETQKEAIKKEKERIIKQSSETSTEKPSGATQWRDLLN